MSSGGYAVLSAVAIAIIGAALWTYRAQPPSASIRVNPSDEAQVLRGRVVYEAQCAVCHGGKLEGQPEWRARRADGRLPAPPHDDTGHTWHHPDAVLFGIVKYGLVPPYAPAGYASDMPGFAAVLRDEDIAATLAYIESKWSPEVRRTRQEMLRQ